MFLNKGWRRNLLKHTSTKTIFKIFIQKARGVLIITTILDVSQIWKKIKRPAELHENISQYNKIFS